MLARAGKFRQAPSAAGEAARRKLTGAHGDLTLPASVGGGFRWGGQIMHSPDEAYSFAHSHGSPMTKQQFFARYNELGQMEHPAAEAGLQGAVPGGGQTVQPGGPMMTPHPAASPALEGAAAPQVVDPGFLIGELGGRLQMRGARAPNRGGSSRASAVRQALLAAHVIHKLRGLAALQHAGV